MKSARWACIVAAFVVSASACAQTSSFVLEEATIASVHAAMQAKQLTCRQLVDAYLDRIARFDKPAVNAVVLTNPRARDEADALDRELARRGLVGPLHCVPAIVKDNFETIGLQSAAGSASLAGYVSARDAFQVRRIKEAGAIVLAKSNMGEFAFSPLETVSSLLGTTHNPYALDRVPAGSSGGTAAAVAANFGLIGLGSDTGNSIRGPAAHTALVGIRSTMGLTSRAGVIPLNYLADVAGPMTRTVEDAAAVLQAIVGEDPEDPATAPSRRRAIPDYRAALARDGLEDARIGVLRQAYERGAVDPEIARIFEKALDDLKAAGAEIVDTVRVEVPRPRLGACRGFEHDMNEYLRTRGRLAPVHSVEEILRSGKFHESVRSRLEGALAFGGNGPDSDACTAFEMFRTEYGAAVTQAMDELRLDAFVYPTWSFPPQPIGETNQRTAGDNSQEFAPISGFPAINVPMGFSRNGTLPAGITFLGRAWSEATLLRLTYAYEQATRHRKLPPGQQSSFAD